VTRVLITGMSGVGKSSVVTELVARGFRAIDTDDGWSEPTADGRQRWREDAVEQVLRTAGDEPLFLAGCEENQGRFRPWFDHVVLLTAPVQVLVDRVRTRTTNSYGRHPGEFERFLADVRDVEPLLRASADHEIDTRAPLAEVVAEVLRVTGLGPR
jgi:dephospho-CoA kinase